MLCKPNKSKKMLPVPGGPSIKATGSCVAICIACNWLSLNVVAEIQGILFSDDTVRVDFETMPARNGRSGHRDRLFCKRIIDLKTRWKLVTLIPSAKSQCNWCSGCRHDGISNEEHSNLIVICRGFNTNSTIWPKLTR